VKIYVGALKALRKKEIVQVRAVKIYVGALKALRKKEKQDETQFTTKIDGFFNLQGMLTHFFAGFL
jgi:hypothetical protein